MRVVKLMLAVVIEEELQGDMQEVLVFGVAQSSTHEHWSAISNVTGDYLQRQFMTAKMPKHGIDGIAEVLTRIDQRAVKIEDQQPQLPHGNFAIYLHRLSVYPKERVGLRPVAKCRFSLESPDQIFPCLREFCSEFLRCSGEFCRILPKSADLCPEAGNGAGIPGNSGFNHFSFLELAKRFRLHGSGNSEKSRESGS